MERAKRVISVTKNSSVYIYFSKKHKRVVCKKVLKTESAGRLERFKREPIFLEMLKNNPNCIQIIGCKYEKKGKVYYCKILTEYYEKGNLKNWIIRMKIEKSEFGDRIFGVISKFVNFFAELQSVNVSHRDIKPENIFVSENGEFVIGDFGSSTFTSDDRDEYTIQGTAYFLSPELRQGYRRYIERLGNLQVKYCPYKSDVFSLGLVFLIMATIDFFDDKFSELLELESAILSKLSQISNPVLNSILSKMLQINSAIRPNFLELKFFIDSIFSSKCQNCSNPILNSALSCSSCNFVFHVYCVSSPKCQNCFKQLKMTCEECKTERFKYSNCSHLLCEMCAAEKKECFECCKVWDLEQRTNINVEFPNGYLCAFDKVICELRRDLGVYRCPLCMREFCCKCKQVHGAEECLETRDILKVICKCKREVRVERLESLFFMCEVCGFRCLACFKSINADHYVCSLLFR